MKNADMKVIAIILSIALFFTIVTSNIVSIASIAVLLKGGTATTEDTDKPGKSDMETDDKGRDTSEESMEKEEDVDFDSALGGGDPQYDEDGNLIEGSGGLAEGETSPIETAPLKSYQYAIKNIVENGAAGYTKKSWQSIAGDGLQLDSDSALGSVLKALSPKLTDLIMGFMTTEDAAEAKVNEKGSEDAARRMPASTCTEDDVQSATWEKLSDGNYKVTIVLRSQQNPKKTDTYGLTVMSGDILFMEDVEHTIKTDSTVKALVKELKEGTIDYKDYTITAIMTPDCKFVSIDHDCDAELNATVDIVAVGVVYGSGGLGFHVRYTDFVY
jgi:hypothetical protein